MKRTTTKRNGRKVHVLCVAGRATQEARRSNTEVGQPRRGWHLGAWPKDRPKSLRVMALFGKVPRAVQLSDSLMEITQVLNWLEIVATADLGQAQARAGGRTASCGA
jgi:hypothetical protein